MTQSIPGINSDLLSMVGLNQDLPELQNEAFPSVAYVETKITEFINALNGSYRLSLLNCGRSERQNLIYLLIFLKKSVKLALNNLGKSLRNQEYHFSCGLCEENITINPNQDIWSTLQNHEHFEELYYQFLNNTLDIKPITDTVATVSSTSESEHNFVTEDATSTGGSNTDSGTDQHEVEPSTSSVKLSISINTKDDKSMNNFRFNFNISYDEAVQNKVYPPAIMLAIRRYDKVKEFTILRAGSTVAACLICNCEMNGMRTSKHTLVSHALGQKHLRAAIHQPTLQKLAFYHDFWLKEDMPIQAHLVYFRPYDIPKMKCALCNLTMNCKEILSHILSDAHKKKILEMYEKRMNLYFLVHMQVQAYGITQEEIEARQKEHKLKEEAEARERKSEKNSDSDTPDEAKKLASQPHGVKHNIIKSVQNPESTDSLELLPNRMKEDALFFSRVSKSKITFIRCELCKCELTDDVNTLIQHIVTSYSHAGRNKYNFYCEICNIRINGENAWRNHNFKGPRHVNMAVSRKERVSEYECTTCKTVIFGDELSLTRHLEIGNRGNRRDRVGKLPDPIKRLFSSRKQILEYAAVFAEEAEDVLRNSLTENCCRGLELALSEIFENCKVYPFGSRISGIGNKNSDLDVFVDVGGTYSGDKNQDATDQVIIIRAASKVFIKSKEYANIVQVLTARTPILKIHHVQTELDCDLSFKNGLSVENTKFLRFCNKLQPACQKLILIIKKWAEFIGFECITTYAFAVLCIFYMQVNGYLLSVEKIRQINNVEPRTIGGWKTIDYRLSVRETKPHIKMYNSTVCELVQEFFKYYAKFDFSSYVVCPLLGRVIKRSLFSEGNPEDLPSEMAAYLAQLEGDDPEIFRSNSFMCIQDPFDLSHNLTKAAQQGTLTKFQTMCKLCLTHIEGLK